MSTLKVIPLEEAYEKQFFDFLDRDRVLHIFTICDLRFKRDKTEIWLVLENNGIIGYILEFNKRIVHTHGAAEGIANLLDRIDIDEPVFVIEPHHLTAVEGFLDVTGPLDPSSRDKITTFLVLKVSTFTFKPLIRHRIKRLETEDLNEILEFMGEDNRKRVEETIRSGIGFGAYENESLASIATTTEVLEDLALIRGVYTVPSLRNRGLATSACSALVEGLIGLGKEVVLWVSKDNLPARKVYEKIGFKKTGHILLGFKARRLFKS